MTGNAPSRARRPKSGTVGAPRSLHHALLAVALVLLALQAWLASHNAEQTAADHARTQRAQTAMDGVEEVVRQLTQAESGQRGYLITGDPAFLEPLEDMQDRLNSALPALRGELAEDARAVAALTRLEEAVDLCLRQIEGALEVHRREGLGATMSWLEHQEVKSAMDDVLRESTAVEAILAADRDDTALRERQRVAQTRGALLVTTGVISAALTAWWALVRAAERRRQRALEALQVTEQRLATLTETLPVVLFSTDRAGVVTGAQGRALPLIQMLPGGLLGRRLAGPDAPRELAVPMARALAGEPQATRLELGTRVFQTWFGPTRGRQGEVLGVLGVAIDVTDQAAAERALRALTGELERRVADRTAQLEAANRELESFSYSVSHDLRAPLRAVDGFSAALAEECGGQLPPACNAYLQRVRAAARRMGQLIDDLLLLSRVTRAELHREEVDMSALAHAVLDDLARLAPGRRVSVSIQDGLVARGDPRLLRIVLENLLGNAWKFTSQTESATIRFGAEVDGGRAVFFVADNGAGFDMAFADRLFTPFQRLHAPDEFEGTGIGLATVQRIVTRHGGRVWAEAEPQKGARISFTLDT